MSRLPRGSKLIPLAVALICFSAPAFSQGFDVKPQIKRDPMVRVDPTLSRGYSYSITTGAKVTEGWEKSLTESNPNLRRWTWMPIVHYEHQYKKVLPGAFVDKEGHEPRTSKRPTGGIYVKPIKVALPERKHTWYEPAPVVRNAPSNSRTEVSARIRVPYNGPTQTYSYGNTGRSSGMTSAALSSKDVHGKLLTH